MRVAANAQGSSFTIHPNSHLPEPSRPPSPPPLPPLQHSQDRAETCRPALPRPVAQSVQVNGLTVNLDDVARLAPVVLLHPDEAYLPCSVESVLAGGKLVDRQGAVIVNNPTQEDLATQCESGARVVFDPVSYPGEPLDENNAVRAPMYVSAQAGPNGAYIDLQYIFLFAYNGPQTARVRIPAASFNCTLPSFAEHQGDIEGVHMRVTPDCKSIVRVGVAGHGRPTYYAPEQLTFENTHPLIRCAYNSHATYNHTARAQEEFIATDRYTGVGFGVEFIDLTADNGPRWRPFDVDGHGQTKPNDKLLFVGLTREHKPLGNQPWAAFRGALGARWTNSFRGAQGIGGRKLTAAQARYTNTIARAAVAAGATKKRVDSNGTAGLGVRTWIHEDAVEDRDARY